MYKSEKSWLVTGLLCFFLGYFGVHRFYAGRVFSGVIMLLTAGTCGIWQLIDFIIILCGRFEDGDGYLIKP